jgi:branched-chain amino acid transport system permease protein
VLGAVVERVLIRHVENAPPLNAVILTLGLYTLLVAAAGMIWGNTPRSFPAAFSLRGYEVGGTRLLFTPNDTFIVLVVVAVAVGLGLLFRFTSLGLQMRASAFAPEVARLLGVRLISGFVAAVLGGLDSPPGAVVGGLVLGVALSYVAGYEGSSLVPLAALVILVAVLMVRPGGLFPASKERRV